MIIEGKTSTTEPVERNIAQIRQRELELIEQLTAANAAGDAPVYPVAIRTKYCACPDHALTDCRFNSRLSPGWEVCPELTEASQVGTLKTGRWLYVTTGEPLNQDDPSEAQDNALAERLTKELISSVQ